MCSFVHCFGFFFTVVVDCSDSESINTAMTWYSDITQSSELTASSRTGTVGNRPAAAAAGEGVSPIPILLMGSKHDLLDNKVHVKYSRSCKLSCCLYFSCTSLATSAHSPLYATHKIPSIQSTSLITTADITTIHE